jgi:MFS family permease
MMAFLNLGHLLTHLSMLIFPTAALGMGEFSLPFAALIGLAFGGYLAFGLGAIPAGWLGDLWSRPAMLGVFFGGLGASLVLTGFASSPAQLAIGLTFVGLFASIYHPVGTSMVTDESSATGRDLGVNGLYGNAGVALSALVAGLLTQWAGWRWAFFAPGAVSLLTGVAYFFQRKVGHRAASSVSTPLAQGPSTVEFRRFLWLLGAQTLAGGVVFTSLTLVLPHLLSSGTAALAASPTLTGLTVAAVYSLGALSQVAVGRAMDRTSIRRTFVPLGLLQAPLLAGLFLSPQPALLLFAATVVMVVFAQVVINDAMVAAFAHPGVRSRVYAVRYFVSFAVGALAVKLVENTYGGHLHLLLVGTLVACGALLRVAGSVYRDPVTPASSPLRPPRTDALG